MLQWATVCYYHMETRLTHMGKSSIAICALVTLTTVTVPIANENKYIFSVRDQ